VVRSVLPPRSREELATTEAPNSSEPPARADPEAPVTTSADPTTFGARPIEFVFSVLGLTVGVLALPIALLFGGTAAGWLLGMVLFAAYWASGIALSRVALNLPPMHAVGVAGLSFIIRVWVVFGLLLGVALKNSTLGVTAMLVFAAAFTFDLLGRLVLFSLRNKTRQSAGGADA
jgi:hypothetical protein